MVNDPAGFGHPTAEGADNESESDTDIHAANREPDESFAATVTETHSAVGGEDLAATVRGVDDTGEVWSDEHDRLSDDAVRCVASEPGFTPQVARRRRKGSEEELVACLASGHSYADVAQSTGLSERTVGRRAQDPEIQARVAALRQMYFERATGTVMVSMADAAAKVYSLALNATNPSVRLRAACFLLTHGADQWQLEELDRRLRILEEIQQAADDEEAGS